MRRTLLKNTLIYSFGEFLPRLLNIVLLPIFTRYLSPADYGIWHYTNSVIMFLAAISILALHSFVLRHYYEVKTELERKRLVGNIFLFVFFFNTLILSLSAAALPVIIDSFNIAVPFFPYFFIALLTNYLNVFSFVPLVIYRAREDSKKFALLTVGKALLISGLSFLLVVKYKIGVLGLYYGHFALNIVFCGFYFIVVYKNSVFYFNLAQLKQAFKFSLPLVPAGVSFLVIDLIDRILLERYVEISQIGIYSIAYSLGFAVNIFIQGAYQAFEPRIFQSFGKPDFYNYFYFLKKHYFLVTICVSFLAAVFSKEILVLFTAEQFHSGAVLVPLIVLAAVFKSEYVIYGAALIAEKRTRIIAAITIAGALINIALNLLLLPTLGILGAAMSTAASFLVMSAIACLSSRKLRNITVILKELTIVLLCSGIILSFASVFSDLSFPISLLLKFFSVMFLLSVIQLYYVDYLSVLKEVLFIRLREDRSK